MFGSGVLDTVIGVIFVFLLVSLLVTTGNELLAAVIRSRAKWLEYGIHRLIGSDWAKQLYEHPLIEGSTQDYKASAAGVRPLFGTGPSYIPSRVFANILMELVHGADNALRRTEAALQQSLDMATTGAAAVADIKLAVDQMATSLPTFLPPKAAAAIKKDLEQLSAILGRNDAGRLAGWLGELEGRTRAVTDPTLAATKAALSDLVVGAKNGNLGMAKIRQATVDAIAAVPPGAVGEMLKADLNMVLTRLDAGYTVADAAADVQRFIRSIPAGYVRHLIEELKNDKMRQTLLLLFDDAANDVEKFKQNIEVWFNNAMDRVGGWYKRRAQGVTFGISLLVVVLMNVDALLIVRYLDANSGVRNGLVAQAQAFVDAKAKEPAAQKEVTAGGEPVKGTLTFASPAEKEVDVVFSTTAPGGVFTPKSVTVKPGATSVDYTLATDILDRPVKAVIEGKADGLAIAPVTVDLRESYPAQLKRVQQQLMALKLPIGWVREPAAQADQEMRLGIPDWDKNFFDTVWYHLLGWLITAIAATLGAPFWFDMLNKVMSIRSAGKAPEEMPKSPEVVQAPMAPGQSAAEASRMAALFKK
ncbi:hypothetical protein Q4S45_11830 [Massilia sp. R2A-15]|uniref:hypothetical protein n=1 Tax=Massilia sp. R2A-15 TaxID=3064278 RepID=UPI0027362C17|nr:hypothetical protein [Massilia sp. R2A-15]WLI87438.1 hypothetical protein Q4S45_11830 [Massilia sp. R2A-15]